MDAQALAPIELFDGLTEQQLRDCSTLFKEDRVLMGEHLTDEDDYGYSFFVVLDGSVKVSVDGEEVARLTAGDHFGERALVNGERRNATVTATETCRVAKMMTWDFQKLVDEHPELAKRLEAKAAERTNE